MDLFATDMLSAEGVTWSAMLVALAGGLQWLLGWVRDTMTQRAAQKTTEHKAKRNESHEDEDREDSRWKAFAERQEAVLSVRDAQLDKLRQDHHDQADKFNERIMNLTTAVMRSESRIMVAEGRIRFLEQILDDAKIPHPKWGVGHDSSPRIALSSPPVETTSGE